MQFSHGNAKSDEKPFIKKCEEIPSNVYRHLVLEASHLSDLQPVLTQQNVKQIRNAQASQRQKFRLSHDSAYNFFEMAFDTQVFVHKVESYPDLLVICGHQSLIDELDRIIQAELDFPNFLSYDTTFCLGDICASPFLFCHVIFDSSPVIPAAYLLHECKFEKAHEAFMTFIKEKDTITKQCKITRTNYHR